MHTYIYIYIYIHTYTLIHIYIYIYIYIHITAQKWRAVSSHEFKPQDFKVRGSNPRIVAYLNLERPF